MIDNNNQITTVLVSHELQTMPKLTFPGGSVRKRRELFNGSRSEHPAETAARELQEETGLLIKARKLEHLHTAHGDTFNKHFFIGRNRNFRRLRSTSSLEFDKPMSFTLEELHQLEGFTGNEYYRIFIMFVEPYLKSYLADRH